MVAHCLEYHRRLSKEETSLDQEHVSESCRSSVAGSLEDPRLHTGGSVRSHSHTLPSSLSLLQPVEGTEPLESQKNVQFALQKALELHPDLHGGAIATEPSILQASQSDFDKMVMPGLLLGSLCGNMYTGEPFINILPDWAQIELNLTL